VWRAGPQGGVGLPNSCRGWQRLQVLLQAKASTEVRACVPPHRLFIPPRSRATLPRLHSRLHGAPLSPFTLSPFTLSPFPRRAPVLCSPAQNREANGVLASLHAEELERWRREAAAWEKRRISKGDS
jgi:hypothetical protein